MPSGQLEQGAAMSLGKRYEERQQEFWTPMAHQSQGPGHVFYDRLNQVLAKAGFDKTLEQLCAPLGGWGGGPLLLILGHHYGPSPRGTTIVAGLGLLWGQERQLRHTRLQPNPRLISSDIFSPPQPPVVASFRNLVRQRRTNIGYEFIAAGSNHLKIVACLH